MSQYPTLSYKELHELAQHGLHYVVIQERTPKDEAEKGRTANKRLVIFDARLSEVGVCAGVSQRNIDQLNDGSIAAAGVWSESGSLQAACEEVSGHVRQHIEQLVEEGVLAKDAQGVSAVSAAQELELLREYRLATIAFNNSHGVETETLEEAVEIERKAEDRYEAAAKACWDFYAKRFVPAQECPADDDMCNPDNPEMRCICREEFGYRVCVEPKELAQECTMRAPELVETFAPVQRCDCPFCTGQFDPVC